MKRIESANYKRKRGNRDPLQSNLTHPARRKYENWPMANAFMLWDLLVWCLAVWEMSGRPVSNVRSYSAARKTQHTNAVFFYTVLHWAESIFGNLSMEAAVESTTSFATWSLLVWVRSLLSSLNFAIANWPRSYSSDVWVFWIQRDCAISVTGYFALQYRKSNWGIQPNLFGLYWTLSLVIDILLRTFVGGYHYGDLSRSTVYWYDHYILVLLKIVRRAHHYRK